MSAANCVAFHSSGESRCWITTPPRFLVPCPGFSSPQQSGHSVAPWFGYRGFPHLLHLKVYRLLFVQRPIFAFLQFFAGGLIGVYRLAQIN